MGVVQVIALMDMTSGTDATLVCGPQGEIWKSKTWMIPNVEAREGTREGLE